MRLRPMHVVMTAALIVLVPLCVFSQGLYWESKTTAGRGEWTSKSYYMPKMFKIVSGEGNEEMLFRLDQEKVYRINPSQKTYTEMTFDELENSAKSMQSKMDARKKEMEERLKQMPEAQRKQMERMLPGMMGGAEPVTVKNTGERRTISGFSCTKYVATQGEREVVVLWTTTDVQGLDQMKKDMSDFAKRMAVLNPVGKAMYEAMEQAGGFTIEADMGTSVSTVVTKVDHRSIPDSEFIVPAGYTKVQPETPLEGKEPN